VRVERMIFVASRIDGLIGILKVCGDQVVLIEGASCLLHHGMVGSDHGNGRVWKAWKAMMPASHPSHTLWKSLRDSHIPTVSTTGSIFENRCGRRHVRDACM
jgi:hypothetical protein